MAQDSRDETEQRRSKEGAALGTLAWAWSAADAARWEDIRLFDYQSTYPFDYQSDDS
jgi:hypothetical protein